MKTEGGIRDAFVMPYRDILDLVERGALRKDPGGRSTS
jgi:hypothetical protein